MTNGAIIALARKLGGGGGSKITVEELSVTANDTYTAPEGKAYSPVIVNVPTGGGGGGAVQSGVNFIDYDGSLVQHYSKDEFLGLSAMPSNPSHDGLVAQGWNWSLADAKAYVQEYGSLIIGQMYTTDTGETHIYIHIDDDTPQNRLTFYVRFTSTVANNVDIDWGDGTVETKGSTTDTNYPHTYVTGGVYVIKLKVNTGTISFIGSGFYSDSGQSIYGDRANTYSYNRVRITQVEVGNGVTSIGQSAFYGCYSLTSITIPEGVNSIGNYAFCNCYSLKSITIPNSVTSIGNNAFNTCYYLISIAIPNSVTIINSYVLQNCKSLKSITIPNSVTSIGNYAFNECNSLISIIIPNSVTSIGGDILSSCNTLASIIIPNGVTTIEQNAFNHCYILASITIPNRVTSIKNYAFSTCHSLASITIPDSVTSIGNYVFSDCYSLTSITIPDSVTSIGSNAFNNCCSVSEYHLLPNTPPTLANTNAFTNIPSDCKIYVPYSADHSILSAYQSATNWASYKSKMVEEPQP